MGHLALTTLLAVCLAWQQPADATEKFSRAVELQRQGNLTAAAAEYRAALALKPDYLEAQANLGVVLSRLGRYDEAVAAYESALRLAPRLTPIRLNLGIAHYRGGHFAKAVEVFTRLLDEAPETLQARQLLGLSLLELGRDAEAVPHLEQSLTAAPQDPAVLYSLGLAYLRLGRSGVRAMLERLAAFPEGIPALHLLQGQAFIRDAEFEKAIEELTAAARLNPELPRLQYSLGLAYLKLGRHKEAIAAFENELARRPTDYSLLYSLAYVEEAEGSLAAARQHLGQVLEQDPQSAEANALLGKILTKQGKDAEALAPLELAVAKDPTDPLKRYLLARLYRQLGRRADAEREFAEVRRLKEEQVKQDRARTPKP